MLFIKPFQEDRKHSHKNFNSEELEQKRMEIACNETLLFLLLASRVGNRVTVL